MSIFISYSHSDKRIVEQLYELLNKEYNVVYDHRVLEPGDDWLAVIKRQIAECDLFFYLISPKSLESVYCKLEFAEAQRLHKFIIPILICEVELPTELQKIHYVDMSKGITVNSFNDLHILISRALRSQIMGRSQIDHELGEVEERFRKAKREVCISGNDCAFVAVAEAPKVERLLSRGIYVKVLVVDPDSPATSMLPMIDPRFPTEAAFKQSMSTVLFGLREFKRRFPDHFEYRLLPILPAFGFFIIDPESADGLVKIEIYTAKDWGELDTRPHLQLRQKKWRDYFLNQWANYWALGKVDDAK